MEKNNYKKYQQYFDLEKIIANIKDYLPDFNEELFRKAFVFAEEAHEGQMRKDNVTPYIVHPVKSVEILTSIRADNDTLISAMLHDVPEDTKIDLFQLKDNFGEEVSFLVDGITKLSKVHYQYNMPERQIESLKKLFLHSAKDPRVILIKLADRLHNMQTLKNIEKPEKRMRIARETLEIYVPIANLLGIRDLKFKLEDWCFRHLFPSEYYKLKGRVEESQKKHQQTFKESMSRIEKSLKKENIEAKIDARQKSLYSIYKKICSQGKTIDDIDDRIGIRIIVDSIPKCYQVLGIVHGLFIPKPQRFKDYIANPKPNGYQSLHTCVFGLDGVVTEVQIRTQEMHLESEYGIASHYFYKKAGKDSRKSLSLINDKRSYWVRKILDMEKLQKEDSDDFIENLKLDIFQDRIFVFTPKGATIDLPKDASAIDFAYAIHTEIGDHAQKADINGEVKSITTTLKTGDVVTIISAKESSPELYWLSFAKTNLARNKIRAYLKKISRNKKIRDGRKILQKEFDIAGLGLFEDSFVKRMKHKISKSLGKNFQTTNDLLISIGEGSVKASNVVRAIKQPKHNSKIFNNQYLSRFFSSSSKPVISIKIAVEDRKGILREVLDVFYRHSTALIYVRGWTNPKMNIDYFLIKVAAEDFEEVSMIFDEIEQIDGILEIQRLFYRAYFYITAILTLLLWGIYPFIPKVLANFEVISEDNHFVSNVLLYIGFFALIYNVFVMTNNMKRTFPLIRHQKRIWFIAIGFVTIAFSALLTELIYFQVNLSWLVIFVGLLFVYFYLGMSYLKLRKTRKEV